MSKQTVTIITRVSPETKALAQKSAEDSRRSLSSFIAWLIDQHIRKNKTS